MGGVPNLRARLSRALHRQVEPDEPQGRVLLELLGALERAQHEIRLLRDEHTGGTGGTSG